MLLSSARSRVLAGVVASGILFLAGMSAPREWRPSPTPAALEGFETLAASKMGVDHAGNLWGWNRRSGKIQIVTPAGERRAAPPVEEAGGVDVDAEWGVVAVLGDLRWLRSGQPPVSIPLGGQAADVCWIDQRTVAVTPQTGVHRIEIWDLPTRSLVRAIGREEPPPAGPGAVRLRSVLLQFDRSRQLLHSLESFTGDLEVFRPTGELVWKSTLPAGDHAEVEAAIAASDRQAKAAGRRVPLTFGRLYPALDAEGNLWVIQDSRRATKSMDLLRVSPAGSTAVHLDDSPCPTQTVTFWGDVMLFYTDPARPGGICNATRRP